MVGGRARFVPDDERVVDRCDGDLGPVRDEARPHADARAARRHTAFAAYSRASFAS